LLPLLLGLGATSCIITADNLSVNSNRRISAQTLEQIKPGASTEYIESLLGTPTTRTPTASGEQSVVWRYESWEKNTYVLFENGRVSKTWQD
jgi:hypothetical protein